MNSNHLCRLLIVEDEPLLRKEILHILDWQYHGFQIVGEASNGLEGIDKIHELCPDIVLLDIQMPVMDGLEMLRVIKAPGFPVQTEAVVLSEYSDFDYVRQGFTLGARDYLLKSNLSGEELLSVLTKLMPPFCPSKSAELSLFALLDSGATVMEDTLKKSYRELQTAADHLFYPNNAIPLSSERFHLGAPAPVFDYPFIRSLARIYDHEKISDHICDAIHTACSNKLFCEPRLLKAMISDIYQAVFFEAVSFIEKAEGYESQRINHIMQIESTLTLEHLKATVRRIMQEILTSIHIAHTRLYGKIVREVLAYMREHFMEPITLHETARLHFVNKSYLCQLFRQKLGTSFNGHLLNLRLEASKGLLLNTDKNIHLISAEIGFSSASYFAKYFKKAFGITPRKFRAGAKEA